MNRKQIAGMLVSLVVALLTITPSFAIEPERGEGILYENLAAFLGAQEGDSNLTEDPDDPAHALYQRARSSLSREHYRHAAELFAKLTEEYPKSVYASDALYWKALALYQLGDSRSLEEARETLERLALEHREAAMLAEARSLQARIRSKQARSGNRDAAEDVYRQALELAEETRLREKVRTAEDPESADPASDCEDDHRMTAVQALLQMNSARALPILKKVLEKRDDCWQLRERALFVLSQNSSPEVTEILIAAAKDDPHPEVRQQAVFWLSQVPGEASLDAIQTILSTTDDPELEEKCIFALSQHHSERAAQALRQYATDRSKPIGIREHAVFWLGQNHAERNFDFLAQLYGELQEHDLKERVIFSVAQSSGPNRAEWLRQRALDKNESSDLRKNALFWAAQQKVIRCDDFAELYSGFEDHEMRQQVVFGLSQSNADCSVETLIKIYRIETDVELKRNIVFWLGQSNDERAFRFIEELIDQ